jgi:hypothetical protein
VAPLKVTVGVFGVCPFETSTSLHKPKIRCTVIIPDSIEYINPIAEIWDFIKRKIHEEIY